MGKFNNSPLFYIPSRRKLWRVAFLPFVLGIFFAAHLKYNLIKNSEVTYVGDRAERTVTETLRNEDVHVNVHDNNEEQILNMVVDNVPVEKEVKDYDNKVAPEEGELEQEEEQEEDDGTLKEDEHEADDPEEADDEDNDEDEEDEDEEEEEEEDDDTVTDSTPKSLKDYDEEGDEDETITENQQLGDDDDDKVNLETQQKEENAKPKNGGAVAGNVAITTDPPYCQPWIGCEYDKEVGIRIILLTQKRWESLNKTLTSLSKLVTDGDTAALEIWIDALKNGKTDKRTYKVARDFQWSQGTKRVHLRERNVGILGQWAYTWRAKPGSKELALILEDDIDVSPYFYRYLKQVQKVFGHDPKISGYTLQDEHIKRARNRNLQRKADEQIFMYPMHGCWGFSPHADRWREFQDWLNVRRQNATFHPYVPPATTHMHWFKNFEKRHTQKNMWEMYYYRYAYVNHLWAVHNNLRTFSKQGTGLSYNRREPGLHFKRKKGVVSDKKLITNWDPNYLNFSPKIRMAWYNGKTFGSYDTQTNTINQVMKVTW